MFASTRNQIDIKNMAHNLNLRGVACPMNFVKTKLYLDKLDNGEILRVNLDAGEAVESVYSSIQAEGHEAEKPIMLEDGSFVLTVKKLAVIFIIISFWLFSSAATSLCSKY